MSRMMFIIWWHRTDGYRLNLEGKPAAMSIRGSVDSDSVVKLSQHFADTIKRLEESEGVPITYTSIEFIEI